MRWWDTQVAEGEKPLETWARLHLEIESAKHPVMPRVARECSAGSVRRTPTSTGQQGKKSAVPPELWRTYSFLIGHNFSSLDL